MNTQEHRMTSEEYIATLPPLPSLKLPNQQSEILPFLNIILSNEHDGRKTEYRKRRLEIASNAAAAFTALSEHERALGKMIVPKDVETKLSSDARNHMKEILAIMRIPEATLRTNIRERFSRLLQKAKEMAAGRDIGQNNKPFSVNEG